MNINETDIYQAISEKICSFTLVIHVMLLISFVTTIALLKTASKMIRYKNTDNVWSYGWDVLIKAAAEQKEKFEFLHKIDPDTGLTWLLKACLCGRGDLVQFLLNNGANPRLMSTEKDNALTLATFAVCHHKSSTDNNIIEMLVSSGIDINHANKRGYTPLSIAAANGNMSLVTTLMYYGADPNIPNNDGTLPVQLASSFGHYDVAKLLM